MDAFRTALNETLLISNIPNRNVEVASIAPGEVHKPVSVLTDLIYEKLAHTHVFRTGRFAYKVEIEKPLGAVKYFNQRLLNHTQNLHQTWITYFCSFFFEAT